MRGWRRSTGVQGHSGALQRLGGSWGKRSVRRRLMRSLKGGCHKTNVNKQEWGGGGTNSKKAYGDSSKRDRILSFKILPVGRSPKLQRGNEAQLPKGKKESSVRNRVEG